MVLKLDGTSEIDAHLGPEIGDLICLRRRKSKMNFEKVLFSLIRAQHILSYLII